MSAAGTGHNLAGGGGAVTVSAPGKILLAGGYLVLESPNIGVVLGVNKRFYCTTQWKYSDDSSNDTPSKDSSSNIISLTVTSPQFDRTWKYSYDVKTMQLTTCPENVSRNEMIEKTLGVALLALLPQADNESSSSRLPSEISMTIHGDNDFYSLVPHLQAQQLPRTWQGIQKLSPFLPVVVQQKEDGGGGSSSTSKVLKTGLGSSACLVTSLVAALSVVFQQQEQQQTQSSSLSLSTNEIFALAQICHSHAQGKIGSGFDVAAACYGSNLYQRCLGGKNKEGLTKLLADLESITSPPEGDDNNATIESRTATRESLRQSMADIVEWTIHGGGEANDSSSSAPSIEPLSLPSFLQVMLADVAGGSESPSMARTVLAWKRSQPSTDKKKVPHWDDLMEWNTKIAALLQELSSMPVDLDKDPALLQLLTIQPASEWNKDGNNSDDDKTTLLVSRLLDLRHASMQARFHLKAMGEAAGVPIEPESQTDLADATASLPGVITALVPGAGGYDALACLYINHASVQHGIGKLWADWKGKDTATTDDSEAQMVVCPLGVQAVNYGQGVRVEEAPPV